MATKEIALPDIGEGVTEGEVVKWLVAPGDMVKEDQPLVEVMTDKATVEVPSPVAGTVGALKAKPGDVVKIGGALLSINEGGTAKIASAPAPAPTAVVAAPVETRKSTGGATREVTLPDIGEGVTEGELVKWLVAAGDAVKEDQALVEIMTDKATVEVPCPVSGTVTALKAKAGDVVKIGGALCSVSSSGATVAVTAAHAAPASKPMPASAPAPAPMMMSSSNGSGLDVYPPVANTKVLATPATRRLAREMSVDINGVQGSGNAGRVTRDDVLRFKGATPAGPPMVAPSMGSGTPKLAYQGPTGAVEERVPLRGIRKKIAENMQLYKHIIPHFTLMDEANVTDLVKLRGDLKVKAEKMGVKVTFLPFIMKALIATLREFPMANASIDDAAQEIVYKKYFNIGFAADTPNGLLVPVIKNADHKSIVQISREIVELATKARDGKLALDEMKGATITITNIGSIGGTYATPIINHPEVAILGAYKMTDKPIMKNGEIAFIKSMNFTITADHRLIDGAVAARFLTAFIERIENPGVLMLDMM